MQSVPRNQSGHNADQFSTNPHELGTPHIELNTKHYINKNHMYMNSCFILFRLDAICMKKLSSAGTFATLIINLAHFGCLHCLAQEVEVNDAVKLLRSVPICASGPHLQLSFFLKRFASSLSYFGFVAIGLILHQKS